MAKTPCVGLCAFSKKTGHCKACFRTREEAKRYKAMTEGERRALHADLLRRFAERLEACA